MANFYTDNEDIQFLFKHIDLGKLAAICEEGFKYFYYYYFLFNRVISSAIRVCRMIS